MCEPNTNWWPRSPRTPLRTASGPSLALFVENTAAIFATDNLFPSSGTRRRCTRHLHVATGADSMLDGDYSGVAFALKKTLEQTKQILIDSPPQFCAFPRQFFQARF